MSNVQKVSSMHTSKAYALAKFIILESLMGGALISLCHPASLVLAVTPSTSPSASSFFSMAEAATPADISVQTNAQTLTKHVITLVIVVAALLALYNLIMGAINYINSGGDKGKTEEARNRMIASIVGLLVLASVWAIFNLVLTIGFGSASGIQILQF